MPSHPQDPVYLIAKGDKWLIHPTSPAALAFGTEAEARSRVADEALEQGVSEEQFLVVEYRYAATLKP